MPIETPPNQKNANIYLFLMKNSPKMKNHMLKCEKVLVQNYTKNAQPHKEMLGWNLFSFIHELYFTFISEGGPSSTTYSHTYIYIYTKVSIYASTIEKNLKTNSYYIY